MASPVFPKEGQGFRAEVKIGDELLLVLMATHTAVGPVAALYDAKVKKWRERQWSEDIDDAKAKAEAIASQVVACTRSQGAFSRSKLASDWLGHRRIP